jgi:F-type H+-transporting ATPase subunit a
MLKFFTAGPFNIGATSINNQTIINSPLEQFEVVNLIGLNAPILGYLNISITNLALYSLLVATLAIGLHYYGNNNARLLPSKWSIALESSFSSIQSVVREQMGSRNEIYFPFIYSLFFFILFGNLVSNVPYSFAITSSVIVAIGFSVTIFLGVTILGLYIHKLHFFSFFIPSGTPLAMVPLLSLIEIVSYLARAITLGIRLFANLFAGHSLLKILSTFLFQMFSSGLIMAIVTLIPFGMFLAIIGLEIAVSFIQAYVFVLLTCSYIKDSIDLH